MKCTYLTCMNLNIFFNFYIYRIAKRIFHQNIVHNVVFAKNCNARTQLKMFSELNHPNYVSIIIWFFGVFSNISPGLEMWGLRGRGQNATCAYGIKFTNRCPKLLIVYQRCSDISSGSLGRLYLLGRSTLPGYAPSRTSRPYPSLKSNSL